MNIRLSPEGADGGGTPAAPAAPTNTAVPPPPPAAPPATVAITVEQLQTFMGTERRLAEIEAANKLALDDAARKEALATAKAGDAETALRTTEERLQAEITRANARADAIEGQRIAETKTRTITDALPVERFLSAFAMQIARDKIAESLDTSKDAAGNIIVRERGTFRPAADVIAEKLASPDFAIFLKPSTSGGAGGGGYKPGDPPPAAKKSVADLLIEWEAEHRKASTFGAGILN